VVTVSRAEIIELVGDLLAPTLALVCLFHTVVLMWAKGSVEALRADLLAVQRRLGRADIDNQDRFRRLESLVKRDHSRYTRALDRLDQLDERVGRLERRHPVVPSDGGAGCE
jgi:hypothetical protein